MAQFLFSSLQRRSDKTWLVGLVFIALLAFLPGFFSIPPVDRDETRFAQSTRQMVASGDYIDIAFQDDKRYKKPIGIYWLQAASVQGYYALNGTRDEAPIWVYRLPSLVGLVGAVLASYSLARLFLTSFGAGVSALMFAISILPGFEARIAKTDGVLLFVVLLAQLALAKAWLAHPSPLLGRGDRFLFWGAIGAGVLLKGPIILMMSGLTLGGLMLIDRSLLLIRRLQPVSGLLIVGLMVLPWFVAIGLKSGGAFFVEAGLNDFLGKVASVKESHGGPPGIYLALLSVTFWPASLFLVPAAPFLWQNWNARPVLFALVWVVPSWLVFELTPTKLPHYVLPLYPALALMIGYAMQNAWYAKARWQKIYMGLMFVLPLVLGVVAFGGLLYFEGIFSPVILALASLSVLCGFYAWRLLTGPDRALERPLVLVVISAIAIYFAVYQFAFPRLETIWISNRVVAMLNAHRQGSDCAAPSVITIGYNEPSLAFLGPLDLRFATPESAMDLLTQAPCRRLVMASKEEPAVQMIAAARGLQLAPLKALSGITLNGGDAITLTLFRLKTVKSAP